MSSSEEDGSPRGSDWSSDASFDSDDDVGLEGEDDINVDEPQTDPSVQSPVNTDKSAQQRRESRRPTASALRGPSRGRKSSFSGGAHDQSARVYADALRNSRTPGGHRASISIASSVFSGHLTDDTRRRHRESKKRMECAALTQQLLFQAHELDETVDDAPLWLHASIIPPRWRIQIMEHLTPIHRQMQFCRERVVHAWRLLLPPFDHANLVEYEKRLHYFERVVANLTTALQQCQVKVAEGEQESASVFLQLWYRRSLARRGFYTKTIKISRHHRGLIPGMFDTIAAKSKMTVDKRTEDITLEYPLSPAMAKHAFL